MSLVDAWRAITKFPCSVKCTASDTLYHLEILPMEKLANLTFLALCDWKSSSLSSIQLLYVKVCLNLY